MSLRIFVAFALGLLASACASNQTNIKLSPAGYYQTPTAMGLTLERPWTEIAGELSITGHPYLTLDGPRLNQVHVIRGLAEGEGLVAATEEGAPVPIYRQAMTDLELVDFLTTSVALFGFQNVVADHVRPDTVAGAPGARVEFSAAKPSGLRMRGVAIAAKTASGLDVLLFFAPEMHYYAASIGEVERMFASITHSE